MTVTEWLLKWYPILLIMWTGIFSIIVFVLHRTYAKRDDHIALKHNVELIEKKLEDFPSERDIHQLELKIESLSGDIRAIQPGLNQVKTLSDMLLENELLNKKDS